MNFTNIKKIIRRALKEADDEALKNGVDITTEEYKRALELLKERILVEMGIDPAWYYEQERAIKDWSVSRKKEKREEITQEIQQAKEEAIRAIPPEKEILPPQIINKTEIVKEIIKEKPQVIKTEVRTREIIKELDRTETDRLGQDVRTLQYSLQDLWDKVGQIKIPQEIDIKTLKKEISQDNANYVNGVFNDMPNWRSLAMGLRGDIDQLSETVKNLSPTETDPLSLHLDQTTPQTITNGIPLLTGLTPTTDYQIATKKYVDDSVATENLWDRTGTTITPHTAGDSLSGFTSISAKSFTAELNYGYYWTNADDRITVDGSHNMTLHNNGADAITILANGNVGIGVTNPVFPLVVKDVNATGHAQDWQKSTGAVFAYADATNSALSSIYFHLGNGGKGQWYPTKLSGISTFQLQWVATANASNPPDVGIKRHGVNVLEVNNGTAGQLATLVAGNVGIGVTDPDAMLEVSGNIHLTTDNDKLLFGTASDASIYYDATNLVINPKEVGSGVVSVLGNINITSSDNYRSMLITQGSAGNNAAITFYEGAFGMNRYATIGTNGAGKFVITSGQFTNSDPYLYFHTSGYGSSIHTSDSSNLYGQANINSEVAIGATYPAIQSLMRGISGSTEIAYSVVSGATYTESQISLYFNGAAVFNEQGNDADFRVEGNTVTHLLFVDASADAVKIQADNSKLFLGAGDDASFYYDASNLIVNPREAGSGFMRYSSAINRRYYHLPLGSANPGASGATWVEAGANTTGGWRLTNATWLLRGQADVHADWDGASDMKIGVNFMVNVDNTGGAAGDTVDLKATVYYKGVGDTATKSQIVEVATTVGQSAQYKQFRAEFTINWDETSNVVEVGDIIAILLNLETDTSEVDDIVVTSMEFSYNTAHIGIESGDI